MDDELTCFRRKAHSTPKITWWPNLIPMYCRYSLPDNLPLLSLHNLNPLKPTLQNPTPAENASYISQALPTQATLFLTSPHLVELDTTITTHNNNTPFLLR